MTYFDNKKTGDNVSLFYDLLGKIYHNKIIQLNKEIKIIKSQVKPNTTIK
jgi:hypothetical protein